jgi:bifunctional isochorismate lyase/aryl carrier protein
MKSAYFTRENIDDVSKEMLQRLGEMSKRDRFAFSPDRAALLILDMQKFFLDESSHAFIPSALSIVPKIKRLAEAFMGSNLPVISTRHINSDEDAMMMARWWKDIIRENDPLSETITELEFPKAIVIKKTQYDSFYQTSLEDRLRGMGIRQLVVTGVMTHLCCETTSRSAFVRGFPVFIPVDGTATYNEDFHFATYLNLSHGVAVPVLSEEILKQIEAK